VYHGKKQEVDSQMVAFDENHHCKQQQACLKKGLKKSNTEHIPIHQSRNLEEFRSCFEN